MAMFASCVVASLLIAVCELGLRSLPTPYKTKYQGISRPAAQIKLLILGNSHFFYGLNPEYFSMPAFNAANVSQDPKYDLHILKTALDNNPGIQSVVLPLSIFSLKSELDGGVESWRRYQYRLYMGYRGYPWSEQVDPGNFSLLFASQHKLKLLQRLLQHWHGLPSDRDWTDSGWGSAYSAAASRAQLEASGQSAASRHLKFQTLNSVSVDSLKQIIELCASRNIRLLMVVPPAFETYREHIPSSRRQEVIALAQGFAAAQPSVRLIDLFADSSFGAEDYFDADHLNRKGAEKLSRKLDDLLLPWPAALRVDSSASADTGPQQ